jgi:hypothetical protein
MKKIFLLAIVLLVVTSCINNNERKAKKLIEEHLEATMNDYSSYESMEFGSLDSAFSKFEDTKEYEGSLMAIESSKGQIEFYKKQVIERNNLFFKTYLEKEEIRYSELKDELYKERSSYKGNFIGWNMSHQFRGANAFGGKIIGMMTFYFDKEITTVTDVVDLNEKLRNIPE